MQVLGVMPRYYAQAKQYLYDRDELECATADQLEKLADYLRHQDFRRHIEPYLKQKQRLVGDFFALQATPNAKMPAELEKVLAQWDEMINAKALEFGYSPDQLTKPHGC
jgi:hypothetical protein